MLFWYLTTFTPALRPMIERKKGEYNVKIIQWKNHELLILIDVICIFFMILSIVITNTFGANCLIHLFFIIIIIYFFHFFFVNLLNFIYIPMYLFKVFNNTSTVKTFLNEWRIWYGSGVLCILWLLSFTQKLMQDFWQFHSKLLCKYQIANQIYTQSIRW